MPSMLGSLIQGVKNYKKIADYQLRNNTVAQSYESAKRHEAGRARAVAGAIGAGAATFLAPPIVIGAQAVRDYRDRQRAAMQKDQLSALIECLKSHGITPCGAAEMAGLVISRSSTGHWIGQADYKMWMVVASCIEPELARYPPLINTRHESQKPRLDLS